MLFIAILSLLSPLFFVASILAAGDGAVTIEVRFERMEDPLGIRDDGRRCDIFSDCDMRVRVQLDTGSYNQSWPGAKDVPQWYMIDLPGDTNMVRLMKTMLARRSESEYHEDADGNVLVNFRANVEDRNFWTANRLIERFNCLFSQIPSNSSSIAQWTPPLEQDPMQCYGEIHFARPPAERPAIYYRWRIYKTDLIQTNFSAAASNKTTGTFHSRRLTTTDDTVAVNGPDVVGSESSKKSSLLNNFASAFGSAFGAAVSTALGTNSQTSNALARRFMGVGGSEAPGNTPSADREVESSTAAHSPRRFAAVKDAERVPKLWVKVTDPADVLPE